MALASAGTTRTTTATTITTANASSIDTDDSTISMALVAYLRSEADLSEQKAKSLRAQAAQIAALYGISDDSQQRYELDPSELPALDDRGIPKYKGKKRGRKPKERKRKANPNRKKRQHTAYTLFVQENYPAIKAARPGWQSKDLIAVVAKQWADVPPEEKRQWKSRAVATHDDDHCDEETDPGKDKDAAVADMEAMAAHVLEDATDDDEDDDDEQNDGDDVDEDGNEQEVPVPKRRTPRSRT